MLTNKLRFVVEISTEGMFDDSMEGHLRWAANTVATGIMDTFHSGLGGEILPNPILEVRVFTTGTHVDPVSGEKELEMVLLARSWLREVDLE